MPFSAEAMRACEAEGGCALASKARFAALLQRAYDKGMEEGTKRVKGECWANTSEWERL